MSNLFFGTDMVWWMGVVEKRDDVLKIGRCRVRIFNHHSSSKIDMPTEELPWAYPSEPISGTLFSTPKENDMVFGFFADGSDAQQPIMVGKLPVVTQNKLTENIKESEDDTPTSISEDSKGFVDSRSIDELKAYPRQLIKYISYDLTGAGMVKAEYDAAFSYPLVSEIGTPSTPSLARNANIPPQISGIVRVSGIPTAINTTWSEPSSMYRAVAPFNHVYESESKHVMEFDDTPGAERVRIMHRTGSQFEFQPDGSITEKILRNKYSIVLGSEKVVIYGRCDVTIMGDVTLNIKGDYTTRVKGNYRLNVGGNMETLVGGNVTENVHGDKKSGINGAAVIAATGNLNLAGAMIYENSSSGNEVDTLSGAAFETAS